ncbi:MAG: DUF4440 domain-containing protein [Acidobacteria bacterium]|nr:DUF4440 domain-containing protein [Acidobacteriota bacterium]
MKMFFRLCCLISLLGVSTSSLLAQQKAKAPAGGAASVERAIRTLAGEWWKSGAAKDANKFVSFYSEDAELNPPNAPVARGKEAILKVFAGLFGAPGFKIAGRPVSVEAAKSGDYAFETGTFELTMKDAAGKLVTTPGKYIVVWKKQADGTWKAYRDIFNADK